MSDREDTQLRQYLLGELADEPSAAIEGDYFAHPDTFDRVWAAENDLIDAYLDGRLSGQERDRFERHYLASPGHRHRVAVARQLRSAASSARPFEAERERSSRWTSAVRGLQPWRPAWMAFVAAIVVLAIGGVWIVRSRTIPQTAVVHAPHQTPQAPRPDAPEHVRPGEPGRPPPRRSPTIVAVSISPAAVRGPDEATTLKIPPGADMVAVQLEGEAGETALGRGRVVIRTVSGAEVWRGATAPERSEVPPALARVEIPADRLAPDDYIIELFGTDAQGREAERHRYFLRVRAR